MESVNQSLEKSLKDCALEYAGQGLSVHPLHNITNDGLCSCGNPDCPRPGKHPRFKNWENLATTDKDKIADWWRRNPKANIGLAAGKSGLLILDVDLDKGGRESLAKISREHGDDWQKTFQVKTGSGGDHYYFRQPGNGPIGNSQNLGGYKGIDLRGDGGYVVAPPSNHISGGIYVALSPPDTHITSTPSWLLKLVGSNGNGAGGPGKNPEKDYPPADEEKIREGCSFVKHCWEDRADLPEYEWFILAGILGRCENGEEKFREYSKDYPGYSPQEARVKFKHAQEKGPRSCRDIKKKTQGIYCEDCPHKARKKFFPIFLGRDPADYKADLVAELNKEFFLSSIGNKVAVVREIHDPHTNRPDLKFYRVYDFENLFRNQHVMVEVNGRLRPKKLGAVWMDDPGRREYKDITFAPPPRRCPQGYYNLWRGFACEPIPGDWSLLDNHIFEVLAGGNREHYNFLKAWAAELVQAPGQRDHETALVFRSEPGTGKGIYVNQLGSILGPHFLHLSDSEGIIGKFNNHLKYGVLVYADEAVWGGNKKGVGNLKRIISEPTVQIEPKGFDRFSTPNFMHFIFSSNENWVVPVGFKDRRFFIPEVSNKYRGNTEYFEAIIRQMANGGREAMLYDLLHYDYSGVNLRQIPRTSGLTDQVMMNADHFYQYWFELLNSGNLPLGGWYWVLKDNLYNDYLEFMKTKRMGFPVGRVEFSKKLIKLFPGVREVRPRGKNESDGQVVSDTGGKRPRYWGFPGLEACRESFTKEAGIIYEWPEPEEESDWSEEEKGNCPKADDYEVPF